MVEPSDEIPMSVADLAAIASRAAAATPWPWRSFIEGRDHLGGNDFIQTAGGDGPDIELSGATRADQDFIAEARQDVPRLLAEVRRLRIAAGEAAEAEPSAAVDRGVKARPGH